MSSVHAFFIVPKNLRRALLALACAAGAMAAHAQSAMPQWMGEGAVRYVCGGIGSDESTAMRAAMKDHPLALLFARSDGAYLANVEVKIKGSDAVTATTLAFRASGPVCLIDLPNGRYVIDAAAPEGAAKTQTVTVGGGSKTADFRF